MSSIERHAWVGDRVRKLGKETFQRAKNTRRSKRQRLEDAADAVAYFFLADVQMNHIDPSQRRGGYDEKAMRQARRLLFQIANIPLENPSAFTHAVRADMQMERSADLIRELATLQEDGMPRYFQMDRALDAYIYAVAGEWEWRVNKGIFSRSVRGIPKEFKHVQRVALREILEIGGAPTRNPRRRKKTKRKSNASSVRALVRRALS